jgi:hypothetical protein
LKWEIILDADAYFLSFLLKLFISNDIQVLQTEWVKAVWQMISTFK